MKTQAILIAAVALLLGTEAGLIKPSPGTAGDLLQGLTRPAPNTRKVLPNLVLSPSLAKALYYAQISLSSTIQREANLINKVPEKELVLDDLHIAIDDDISVQLSNLKLLNVPSIDVTSANANLEFLNLALDIDFGTLQVGGNFEVVSKKALAEIPVTSSGEFILRNSPFKGTGKVGLSLQTNFYKTINYDVVNQPTGSYLTVSYLDNNNKRIISGLEAKNQEAKVVAHINRQLKNLLNRLVQKRLDDILAGVPVDKLIGETRTAESYREHARALRVVANEYADQLLENVRSYVVENGLSEVAVPNIEQSFSKEILFITWHGSFATRDGHARNLASLVRKGDFNLDADASTGAIIVFGSLGLTELSIHYNHYEVEFQDLGPSGSLSADVGTNSIFLRISLVLTPEISITLEDFRIEEATDISVEVTGLGILDWLVSHITTWVIDLFHDQIVGALESQLRDYIKAVLPSVTPDVFFK